MPAEGSFSQINQCTLILKNHEMWMCIFRDINTLVAEQLSNIRSLSQRKGSLNEFGELLQAVSQLHDTVDSANSTLEPHLHKEELKNHLGDGEGSRSRPVCSSPTSSVNSSLYSSWHLMSDITAENEPKPRRRQDKALETLPKNKTGQKPHEISKKSSVQVEELVRETHGKDGTNNKTSMENSAKVGDVMFYMCSLYLMNFLYYRIWFCCVSGIKSWTP